MKARLHLNNGVPEIVNDNGFGANKIAVLLIDEEGQEHIGLYSHPSSALPGRNTASLSEGANCDIITIDGEPWTVSTTLPAPMNTQYPGYESSDHCVAITMACIAKLGIRGRVALITTLPYRQYYLPSGSPNEKAINAVKKAFSKEIRIDDLKGTGELITPVSVEVRPEAVMAAMDILINEQGEDCTEDLETGISVADLGANTFDIATFTVVEMADGSKQITLSSTESETEQLGMYNIKDALANKMKAHLDLKSIADTQIFKVISGKTLKFAGENHDFSELLRASSEPILQQLQAFFKKTVPNHGFKDQVIFVGRGAPLANDYFKLGNGVMNKHPAYANARGALKRRLLMEDEPNWDESIKRLTNQEAPVVDMANFVTMPSQLLE